MSVKKLLVAGAGQMGAGIVQVSAQAGLEVVMIDVADEFVQRGMAGIEKGFARLVEKGRMEAARPRRGPRPHQHRRSTSPPAPTPTCSSRRRPSRSTSRADLFGGPPPSLRRDAVIATNTSSLSVTQAGRASCAEPRALRRHPLLQPGAADGAGRGRARRGRRATTTVAAARAFAEAVGKTPITVKDSPGFVVNRILFPMINEAVAGARRGRRERRGHRHRHEARGQLPDGPAGARRPRRPRHDAGRSSTRCTATSATRSTRRARCSTSTSRRASWAARAAQGFYTY